MRDILNRLVEAASTASNDQAVEAIDNQISATFRQVEDQLEAILHREGIALSLRYPGYLFAAMGSHGMTTLSVYPPPAMIADIESDEDGEGYENHQMLVDALNRFGDPRYFEFFRVNDLVERMWGGWSSNDFGIFYYQDGKQVPQPQADAYIQSLSRTIKQASEP